jgi:hypothetical protein
MAQSRRTEVLKHMIALDLIMSLQPVGSAADAFNPVNETYIKDKAAADRDNNIPPEGDSERPKFLQERSEHLRDLLTEVDPEVYNAYRTILRNEDPDITVAQLKEALRVTNAIYAKVSKTVGATMWCNPPVHPSTYVTREVVSALLADVSLQTLSRR